MTLRWVVLTFAILDSACTVRLSQDAILARRRAPLPMISERVSRKNVEVTIAPTVTLRGWYLTLPDSRREILFFHGNGAGILSSFWALHWLAEEFDANVLALDARGFGSSGGATSIDEMVDDSLRIYDYAATEFGFRERPPIIVGQSMGAASAIRVAANRPVAALALLSPLGSYEDVVAAANATTPWYVHVEAEEKLKELRTAPLRDLPNVRAPTLIVHGAQDKLATSPVVGRIYNACSAPVRKLCVVTGGHDDAHATNPEVRSCFDDFKSTLR